MIARNLLLIVLLLAVFSTKAQTSPKVDTSHSPKKATLLSAALPGAGQIYNRKYWKTPIVWAGMGTSIYFIIDNQKNHKSFKNEYIFRIQNPGQVANYEAYSDDNLIVIQEQYRRWRDLSAVACLGVYLLQIIDATVDAHLLKFDISEDLTLHFTPAYFHVQNSPGLGIKLTF
jgi:hypothetical protein